MTAIRTMFAQTARWQCFLSAALCAAAVVGAAAPATRAQSLFLRPAPPEAAKLKPSEQAQPLYPFSLYAVKPPNPPSFQPNDLITIIIRESTSVKREQSLETQRDYEKKLSMLDLTTLRQFLELRRGITGAAGGGQGETLAKSQADFEGDGEYERKDDFNARVTARIIEVKPNGTLLLEARTTVVTDDEEQTILLSGLCRTDDVRPDNTVLSSQLYNLKLIAKHAGPVRRAARKGWIARALDALLSF
ncbi:MAG: hypothetical protein D6824_09100 [Planctomycetota bacterium]|nr:MAG: hypothetical protein D6824_09100 [Planctomycetota bacterium]